MQCLPQCLRIILISCVHPHQPRPSDAASPNLDEHEVTCLSSPPHLVPIPSHHGVLVVGGADDVQLTHGDVGYAVM